MDRTNQLPHYLVGKDDVTLSYFRWAKKVWSGEKFTPDILQSVREINGTLRKTEAHGFQFWFNRDNSLVVCQVMRGPRGGIYEQSAAWLPREEQFLFSHNTGNGTVIELFDLYSTFELNYGVRKKAIKNLNVDVVLDEIRLIAEKTLQYLLNLSADQRISYLRSRDWADMSIQPSSSAGLYQRDPRRY